MTAKDAFGKQDSPIIFVVNCEQDQGAKDAIIGRFREVLHLRAPEVSFDFRDHEDERWGTGLTPRFKEWSKEAWYVLFVVSNHWAHLNCSLLTELFVLEDRADEISARHGDENRLISMLCLEEPNAKVQTLLAKYHVACLPYTMPELANSSIDILIDRFRMKPVWVAERRTAF